jgi:hypothetical protein
VGDVPTFAIVGPFRCCWSGGLAARSLCNATADYMTPARAGVPQSLFCAAHRPMTAVPIAGGLLLRRVSLTCQVLFTGHGVNPPFDEAEALEQLERAVNLAGGLLNLHAHSSVLGRYDVPRPRQVGAGRPRGV